MSESSDSPSAGQATLLAGRYRLDEVIGRGGMSEVFRATDVRLSRPVAVKVLLDGGGAHDQERFVDEVRTLARLSHTGLVTVYDAGLRPATVEVPTGPEASQVDRPFLVMELVEGPTLADCIAEGPLPLDRVGAVGAQVAEALAYVHEHGVVHRDVKPGNVLCGDQQHVKLADFGIARLLDSAVPHTRPGHAVGTAAYVAPEQVQGDPVDGAADVYSLGLVLLEAITGRREYGGTSVEAAVARLARRPDVPTDLPPPWSELIVAMTDLDPRRRPSAAAVAEHLRAGLSAPTPMATESLPDAVVAPILATGVPTDLPTEEMAPPTSARRTRRMPPAPPPPPPPPGPTTTAARGTRSAGPARRLPAHVLGVAGALLALVVLLVVIAIVADEPERSTIPANTPADLEEPLQQLHDAIDDNDAPPALADHLAAVDDAVAAGDLTAVRTAVEELVASTAVGFTNDGVDEETTVDVFEASRELLAEVPAAPREPAVLD